ncbi:MAG TPA: hypothetical protein VF519_04985 [Mycobacteriales bacterium]|jgi:hypothetical protein
MTRRLTLKSELLAELTSTELAAVAGGYRELPTVDHCLTGIYPSLNYPCPTEECIEINQTFFCTT